MCPVFLLPENLSSSINYRFLFILALYQIKTSAAQTPVL